MKLIIVAFFVAFTGLGAGFGPVVNQTADEQEYEKWMKTAVATVGALRKSIEARSAEETSSNAAKMGEVFKKSEEFWKGRKKDDAVDWSNKASAASAEIESAAKAGDFEKAGAGMRSLMGNCAACHNVYREKLPDGSYKFKQ